MQYKDIHTKIQCNECCPVLRRSEHVSQERLKIGNSIMDYLLELYWQQGQGGHIQVDSEHLASLLDDLLESGKK